jgi:uncharacterized membrane protein YciS (DUF1049 family)
MLRYVVFFLIFFVAFIVAVVFAAINPAPLHLDLAFTELEMSASLVMVAFLFTGWLFGLLCAGFLQLNCFAVHWQLRKALWIAQAELQSLCSMPNLDAD